MTILHIRPALPVDVPALVRIVEAAYRGTDAAAGWTTEVGLVRNARTHPEEVQALIADEDSVVLLAEQDGVPIGCAAVHPEIDGERPEFGLFAVDPARQAGGVGKALLESGADWARRRGDRELVIRVLQSRPELVAWYQRRGFRATGEGVPFAGRAEDLVVPELRMELLVLELSGTQ